MENQERAFCLIYAFNVALGKQLITRNSVLSHAQNLENCLAARLNEVNIAKNGARSPQRLNQKQFYSPTSGKFSSIFTLVFSITFFIIKNGIWKSTT